MLKLIARTLPLIVCARTASAGIPCNPVNAGYSVCTLVVNRGPDIYAPYDPTPTAVTFRLFGAASVIRAGRGSTMSLEVKIGNHICFQGSTSVGTTYNSNGSMSGRCLVKLPFGGAHTVTIRSGNTGATAEGTSAWVETVTLH